VTGGHDTRVSLAALIAIRPGHQARLIFRTHRARHGDKRKGFTETDYARFLDAAHQQLDGPLVLVWDGLNTHTSRAMRELIAARDWLTVCQLPAYAPELNPVEPVWSHLKRSLANLVKQDIGQLTVLVKNRLRRMQYRPGLNGIKLSWDRHQPEDDLGQGCQPGGLAWFAGLVPASWAVGLAFVAASRAARDEMAVVGDLGGQVGGEVVKERRGKSIRSR
jgi:DDE superfamily endonuclease